MVGVGIVIYYPDFKILEESIKSFDEQNSSILLIVNGCDDKDRLNELSNRYECNTVYNDINEGVAKAYNQIMRYFIQRGMQWILLMDQDSVCAKGYISNMERYFNLENIAILCPVIKYDGDYKVFTPNNDYKEIEWCISSGSFINADCWKKTEGFDEDLFIDWVDLDYCLSVREKGFKIFQIQSESMEHSLGKLKIYRLFGVSVRVTNHNPERKYYYIRNAIICARKHKSIASAATISVVLKDYFKVVAFEKNRINKLRNMNKGLLQGINWKG